MEKFLVEQELKLVRLAARIHASDGERFDEEQVAAWCLRLNMGYRDGRGYRALGSRDIALEER